MTLTRTLRLAAGAVIVLALGAWSCGPAAPPPVIDLGMASCVPADTVAIAGVNLARLRASPVYQTLAPSSAAWLAPARDADYLLLAYNGKDLLAIARGNFREPPAGAVMVAKGIAVSGSPEGIRAATAQYKDGQPGGARWLLDRVTASSSSVLWAAAQGGVKLPLSGAANWNKLLGLTEYATLAAQFGAGATMELQAAGRTEAEAREFEETLRATFSLAAMGSAKDPELAGALRSVNVRREGIIVHAALSVPLDQFEKLFGFVAR